MEYKITYEYKAIIDYVVLSNCENIMDAIFKFYEAHSIHSEILFLNQTNND